MLKQTIDDGISEGDATEAMMEGLREFRAVMNLPLDDKQSAMASAFFGAGFAHGIAYERRRKGRMQ
jgi:hypothetical protein